MNNFTNSLNNIKVASPCPADWNAMVGDNRKRFCGECKLNVYNLSGMTRDEAENLLSNSEGRLCVRYYRREDGTVLTQDCPVGWAAFKRRVSKTAAAFASLLFGLVSGLGLTAFFSEKEPRPTMGTITYTPNNQTSNEIPTKSTPIPEEYPVTMGAVASDYRGNNDQYTVGRMVSVPSEKVEKKSNRR